MVKYRLWCPQNIPQWSGWPLPQNQIRNGIYLNDPGCYQELSTGITISQRSSLQKSLRAQWDESKQVTKVGTEHLWRIKTERKDHWPVCKWNFNRPEVWSDLVWTAWVKWYYYRSRLELRSKALRGNSWWKQDGTGAETSVCYIALIYWGTGRWLKVCNLVCVCRQ